MIPPSGLCIGLDPDVSKMPNGMRTVEHIVPFLSAIVEATQHVARAYKINTAFFEQYGRAGYEALFDVREIVGDTYCIVDAKRADIGNTSAAYARALFGELRADAVTVAPYMGSDSVQPFLDMGFTYVLALTSNPGSADFQRIPAYSSEGAASPLYEHVIRTALSWHNAGRLGFVVGATHPTEVEHVRQMSPSTPLLIPGIGAQGGEARATAEANCGGPALYNVGRTILYASNAMNYADVAAKVAAEISKELQLH